MLWKTKGFVSPSEIKMPAFSDESYKATKQYLSKARIEDRIPDGFRDGGRHLGFERDGSYSQYTFPYREITVVDRRNDKVLNDTIKRLKEIFDRNPYMTNDEKVRTLYTYVKNIYAVPNRGALTNEFLAVPVKLGDIIASGAGVCRHVSLTSKVLADEIGLKMSMIRGRHKSSNGHLGAHIWNEVTLDSGKKYLFDIAQRKLINFSSKDPVLQKYFTDSKVNMY